MNPQVIRAGKANMFLSNVFLSSFVDTLNVPVELYNCDGSIGAAIGAGLGANIYSNPQDAFQHFKPIQLIKPVNNNIYNEYYCRWRETLQNMLN
jgi:xylulokinase